VSRHDDAGYRWVADLPPGSAEPEDEERHVAGSVIRFMWDHGCVVPLWDEEGPLPEDPDWLEAELGLSRDLVDDMAAWAADHDALALGPDHIHQAELLVSRLRREVPAGFTVVDRESGH
jgi:hypothetical protein